MIVVVGAGFLGLSCALRLAEAGQAVRVLSRDPLGDTTSAASGAVWFPYLAEPRERVLAWGAATRRELERLAREAPESGVVLREALVVGEASGSRPPWWVSAVEEWRPAGAEELPAGCESGTLFQAAVAETPRYLPWLAGRVAAAGIDVAWGREAGSLAEAGRGADVVVHCAGLGARELAGDDSVVPVRGQTARVAPFGLERVVIDERDPTRPTYLVPRRDDCVVGGTAQRGDLRLEQDEASTREVLERAAALVPALRGARLLGTRVGLRPSRPTVRLELERGAGGPPVVHCYGHGGAGLTLSWGCADEVAALVRGTLA